MLACIDKMVNRRLGLRANIARQSISGGGSLRVAGTVVGLAKLS